MMRIKQNPVDGECAAARCSAVPDIIDASGKRKPFDVGWCRSHWESLCAEVDALWVSEKLQQAEGDQIMSTYLRNEFGVKQ